MHVDAIAELDCVLHGRADFKAMLNKAMTASAIADDLREGRGCYFDTTSEADFVRIPTCWQA